MKSRREQRKVNRKVNRKFKKKMPPMRGLDMSIYVNIARQDPKIWRIFSVLNRDFAAVFNRSSFSETFPDVVFSDIVDHKFLKSKNLGNRSMEVCKCGKTSKHIPTLYGDSDSVFVTTNMYGHTFNLRLQPAAERAYVTITSNTPAPFADNDSMMRSFRDSLKREAKSRQPQNFNKRR